MSLMTGPLACSRLRRSPDRGYFAENARSAFSAKYPLSPAWRSRATDRRERARAPGIWPSF